MIVYGTDIFIGKMQKNDFFSIFLVRYFKLFNVSLKLKFPSSIEHYVNLFIYEKGTLILKAPQ